MRGVVNNVTCALGTGCQWRAILQRPGPAQHRPRPPRAPGLDRTLGRVRRALCMQRRELGVLLREIACAGRDPSPTAAVIDSQSVKGAEKGACIDPPGHGAGGGPKKERHPLVDTQGLPMHAIVHAADMQDPSGDSEAAPLRKSGDGAVLLTATLFGLCPFLLKLHADSGYSEPQFQDGLA